MGQRIQAPQGLLLQEARRQRPTEQSLPRWRDARDQLRPSEALVLGPLPQLCVPSVGRTLPLPALRPLQMCKHFPFPLVPGGVKHSDGMILKKSREAAIRGGSRRSRPCARVAPGLH